MNKPRTHVKAAVKIFRARGGARCVGYPIAVDPLQQFSLPELPDQFVNHEQLVAALETPSGATHFETSDKAILQLSFRYRSDDHFWFTVFHEIGHLLLHPTSPLFVEGQDYEMTEEESEANRFAADALIPADFEADLKTVARDFRAYARLAKRIGVSIGVLVGQMQNRGLLQHDQMNFLKERYDWEDFAAFTL